jgi:hypothetical protein
VEERRGARLVTQRRLEVEHAPEPSVPEPAAPSGAPSRAPTPPRPPDEPIPPSNRGLLERQLRWHRERVKFEAGRAATEPPK